MITIPLRAYKKLVERDEWLGWLEAAGVDNWCGYSEAHTMRDEFNEQENAKLDEKTT